MDRQKLLTPALFALTVHVLLVKGVPASVGADNLLGATILPNGSFEAWGENAVPEGWSAKSARGTCRADGSVFALGKKSARLHIDRGPAHVMLTSAPVPISAKTYHVRFTFRVTGLTKTKSYGGGQADMRLLWQDARGRTVRQDYVSHSYVPLEWSYRDRFYDVPDRATQVRAMVSLSAREQMQIPSTAWFDDVALCPYDPRKGVGEQVVREWSATAGREVLRTKDAPAWFYLAGRHGRERTQAQRVRDADASLGMALHAKPGVPSGIVWHSRYTLEHPPGLYRVFYRLKVPEERPPKPDGPLARLDVISSHSGTRGSRDLCWARLRRGERRTGVSRPGHPLGSGRASRSAPSASRSKGLPSPLPSGYGDISFDFTKRTRGWIAIRVWTPGGDAEFFLDHIRVVQLTQFADADLLAWYPGTAGLMGPSPSLAKRDGKIKVLAVQGMGAERFRIGEALRNVRGCELVSVPYASVQGGSRIDGYPLLWRALREYRLVVLANASLAALGPEQRYQLRELVRLGGGLLLLGGKAAFGAGGIRDSFLEEVLPVAVSKAQFDIVPAGHPIERTRDAVPALADWPSRVYAPYIHEVEATAGATQVLRAGNRPVLYVRKFGEGRVACLAATPYGRSRGGKTFYAESDTWPELMRSLICWLVYRET